MSTERTEYFKVVKREGGRLKSMRAPYLSHKLIDLTVVYESGKYAFPKYGKLFVFKTFTDALVQCLRIAVDRIDDDDGIDNDYEIWLCHVLGCPRRRKYVMSLDQENFAAHAARFGVFGMNSIQEYWREGQTHLKIEQAPKGTVTVDAVKLVQRVFRGSIYLKNLLH